MIKEIFRYILIFIFLIIVTLLFFLQQNSSELLNHFLLQYEDSIGHLFELLHLSGKIIIQHHTIFFAIALIFSGIFFMNTTKLKLLLKFGQGIFITLLIGILLSVGYVVVAPEKKSISHLEESKYAQSYEKLYNSFNILKLNQNILLYSKYHDHLFTNVLLIPHPNSKMPVLYAQNGFQMNNQLILKNINEIKNGKKVLADSEFSLANYMTGLTVFNSILPKVSIDNSLIINYLTMDIESKSYKINLDKRPGGKEYQSGYKSYYHSIGKIIYQWINYLPYQQFEQHFFNQIQLARTNFLNSDWDSVKVFLLLSFILEIIGFILISSSMGVIFSSRYIPLLNFFTSIFLGGAIFIGLIFLTPLIEEGLALLVSEGSLPDIVAQLTGIVIFALGIITIIISYIKYSKIQFHLD